MPMHRLGLLFILISACATPAPDSRPASPAPDSVAPGTGLSVGGDLPRTGSLTQGQLASLGSESCTWAGRGAPRRFTGVPVETVLAHFGFAAGAGGPATPAADKHPGWKRV